MHNNNTVNNINQTKPKITSPNISIRVGCGEGAGTEEQSQAFKKAYLRAGIKPDKMTMTDRHMTNRQ